MGHFFLLLACGVAFVITTVISWRVYYYFVSGYENWTTSRARHLYQRLMISVSSGGSVAFLVYIMAGGNDTLNEPAKMQAAPSPRIVQADTNTSPVVEQHLPSQSAPTQITPDMMATKESLQSTNETIEPSPEKSASASRRAVSRTAIDRSDCSTRQTFIEKRICEDDALAEANNQMQSALYDALDQIGGSPAVEVEQKRWFQNMLVNCYDELCTAKSLRERTAELQARYRSR